MCFVLPAHTGRAGRRPPDAMLVTCCERLHVLYVTFNASCDSFNHFHVSRYYFSFNIVLQFMKGID